MVGIFHGELLVITRWYIMDSMDPKQTVDVSQQKSPWLCMGRHSVDQVLFTQTHINDTYDLMISNVIKT